MSERESWRQATAGAAAFLKEIISARSFSGGEEALMGKLRGAFAPLADSVELMEMGEGLREEAAFSRMTGDVSYAGRHNLVVTLRGTGDKTLILNAHADTVPAPDEMLTPAQKDGFIYGRGACDDKGQIATMYLLLSAFKAQGVRPEKTLILHIVAEEETGGNGTLALTRDCPQADCCITMEPTGLKILSAARGVVWFDIRAFGVSGHSSGAGASRSALSVALRAMDNIERYHAELKKAAVPQPFNELINPMPLNFGSLSAGDWPATVPKDACLKGIIGIVPPYDTKTIMDGLRRCVAEALQTPEESAEVSFPFAREPFETDRGEAWLQQLAACAQAAGVSPEFSVFPACCDAVFYAQKGIPSAVFGAGQLSDAHAAGEKINIMEIEKAARTLYGFASL
jgi:acetylornithine deacetylase